MIVPIEVTEQVVDALINDGVFNDWDDEDMIPETLTEAVQSWVNEAAAIALEDT